MLVRTNLELVDAVGAMRFRLQPGGAAPMNVQDVVRLTGGYGT
jgi:hypothetical protein